MKQSYSKLIGCNIHGHIRVSPMALTIINTEEFQRLRYIKQLGICHFVYPAATHTRFEHSVGVYHLACKVTDKLQKNYPDKLYRIPDLSDEPIKLTDFVAELIKIGGLCHDIGHGPFSHTFDDLLEHKYKSDLESNPNIYHENRSCSILEMICLRELSPELNDTHIKFIKSIMNPQKHHIGAIYQIINNYLNGIDVDKFDYLARDTYALGFKKGFDPRRIIDELIIDNADNIAYPKHCATEIYDMFHTRYMMHKLVYNHKTSKIIDGMIHDIFFKIDPILKLSDSINHMEKFCKLTDMNIFNILESICDPDSVFKLKLTLTDSENKNIFEAYAIYKNILQRKFYKLIAEISDNSKSITHFENFLKFLSEQNVPTTDLYCTTMKYGYVSGNKQNPFDTIYFYNKKSESHSHIINKQKISSIMSETYQETHHLLICKNQFIYSNIKNHYDVFEALFASKL